MMRKIPAVLFIVVFVCCSSICSCRSVDDMESASNQIEVSKSKIEQIDDALQGTWISYDSETIYSEWTFYNGNYVVDTYVNGELLSNSIIGTYYIGSDSIHTLTNDQERNVEGNISFQFENGDLMLIGANGTRLEKKSD